MDETGRLCMATCSGRAFILNSRRLASFMPGGPGMRRKLNCCRAKLFLVFGVFSFDILRAQNIIDGNSEVDSSALAANPANSLKRISVSLFGRSRMANRGRTNRRLVAFSPASRLRSSSRATAFPGCRFITPLGSVVMRSPTSRNAPMRCGPAEDERGKKSCEQSPANQIV